MKPRERDLHQPRRGSLPSRERELKPEDVDRLRESLKVAPLAGARIETPRSTPPPPAEAVAPLAGARIETEAAIKRRVPEESLPSRERELKLSSRDKMPCHGRRSPRGSAN